MSSIMQVINTTYYTQMARSSALLKVGGISFLDFQVPGRYLIVNDTN